MIGISLTVVLFLLCSGCGGERRWNYEPISLDTQSTDSNKVSVAGKVKRMPRGEFSYDIDVNIAYDVDENTMVEGSAFHSQSGNDGDYNPTAFTIPKQNFTSFIDNYYKDMIYKNLASCSNLPTPEEVLPWKRGNYTFRECVFSGDGMPEMIPQGYYKLLLSLTGEVDWGFQTISRITDKMMF